MTDFGDCCYNGTGSKCSGGPQPGVIAARSVILQIFIGILRSLGIYNCRPVRGGGSLSTHGEGRGFDCGCNANVPKEKEAGDKLAAMLIKHYRKLGIQRIIWNRRQWDCKTKTWRAYGGVSPHTDHLHIEFCWAASVGPKRLTERYVWAILSEEVGMSEAIERKLDQVLAQQAAMNGRLAIVETSLGLPYEDGLSVQKGLVKRVQVRDENGPVFTPDGKPVWDYVEHLNLIDDELDGIRATQAEHLTLLNEIKTLVSAGGNGG